MRRYFLPVFRTASLALFAGMVLWPFHDGALRYGLPLSLIGVWISGLSFLRARSLAWFGLLFLPTVLIAPFCLPGKPIDPAKLAKNYLAELQRMEGTRYLWGGESAWGIDCSGLPRRALRNALMEKGFGNANGAAFREWARQWWFDTSAKALGEGYRGFTRPLGIRGKLCELQQTTINPGDLAVTTDGRHLMVCFGNGKWIQADPLSMKVTIAVADARQNPWFGSQVTMHRWALLGSGL